MLETKREDLYTVDTAVDLEGTVESIDIKNAKDETLAKINGEADKILTKAEELIDKADSYKTILNDRLITSRIPALTLLISSITILSSTSTLNR